MCLKQGHMLKQSSKEEAPLTNMIINRFRIENDKNIYLKSIEKFTLVGRTEIMP